MPGTRKLGRTSDSRNAMMRAMVTYLLENGKIETTVTRAKDVRSMAEKMITLGKARRPAHQASGLLPTSPRKMLQRSCLMRSAPSTLTATAATPASSRSALAAATPPRWLSSSWFDFKLI